MAKVAQICELIDQMAPFGTAEAFDNVGLLVGDPGAAVDNVLVALDLSMGAIEEARAKGCQLILTHHPVLFHARKDLRQDDAEGMLLGALIRAGIALVAAHTNWDKAAGGVSETLAGALGLGEPRPAGGDGLVFVGEFDGTLSELADVARRRVNPSVRVYGADRALRRVAVCGGAGSDMWPVARGAGADAFLLGEIRHHDALAAVQMGMAMLDAGHHETEVLSVKALVDGLQTRANAVEYKVRIMESRFEPFR